MTENKHEHINLFMFKVEPDLFALYLSNVSEVIHQQDIINIPGKPMHLEGVILQRGIVIPLINLKKFFFKNINDNNKPVQSKAGKDLVLCTHKDIKLAFIVDKIFGLRSIDVESSIDHEIKNDYFIVGFKINLDNEIKPAGLLDLDKLIPAISKHWL